MSTTYTYRYVFECTIPVESIINWFINCVKTVSKVLALIVETVLFDTEFETSTDTQTHLSSPEELTTSSVNGSLRRSLRLQGLSLTESLSRVKPTSKQLLLKSKPSDVNKDIRLGDRHPIPPAFANDFKRKEEENRKLREELMATKTERNELLQTCEDMKRSNESNEWVCSICFHNKEVVITSNGGMLSTLCGHVFCAKCLKKALKRQRVCPMCRLVIAQKSCRPVFI